MDKVIFKILYNFKLGINDLFKGKMPSNLEISEFASFKNPVGSSHDAFRGKSDDKPVISAFKKITTGERVYDKFLSESKQNRPERYSTE